MRVTFALLSDYKIHNLMRKIAVDINKKYKVGFMGAQVPPHISLKQPFIVSDLIKAEEYFDELAATIKPIDIFVPEVYVWISEQMGGIFFDVQETSELRNLHNRVNSELKERFGNTDAAFDGDAYHFHATIALGGSAPIESYSKYFSQIEKSVKMNFTANEIVMFYNENNENGSFITYKILPLTGR